MFSSLRLFFIFSFVGWILDTGYRSLQAKKYSSGSFFPFLTPIYGFAGLMLTIFFTYSSLHLFFQIFFGTVLVVLLEFCGAFFCEKILKKRYWDYSEEKWNLYGYISFLHTFYWLLLVTVFRIAFPFLPL